MKTIPLVLLAASLIALAGCSSTPTQVDRGVIHARTFSFVDPGSKASPAFTDNRQPIHAVLQECIAKGLGSRGATQVASGGDVTVGYLIITGNNASVTSVNDYFGHGEDAGALSDKALRAHTSSKNPNYFEAGTLVIDIVDSKTFQLLKRGYATRSLLRNLSVGERTVRIQGVVDEILGSLRFAP